MKIKDIETMLGISRANVRFYEREGLLSPKRQENAYRDYDGDDIERLQRIIILRKLGFSINDIKYVFNGDLKLASAAENRAKELTEQISQLTGALEVCKQIQAENVGIENIDCAYYQSVIDKKQNEGKGFFDIAMDCANAVFGNFKYVFFGVNLAKYSKPLGMWGIPIVMLVFCLLRGLGAKLIWHRSFIDAFLYPLKTGLAVYIILLPITILSVRHKKAASIIVNVLLYVCIALLLGLVLLFVFFGANQLFHFLPK